MRSSSHDYDQVIREHTTRWLDTQALFEIRNRFARDGFVLVPDIVPAELKQTVKQEVLDLLGEHAERRDLLLKTTGGTPRFMSVVRSEIIAERSELIATLYECPALASIVEHIAGERPHPCPAKDEEFLITRQEKPGDTHGWHWGDFSFALIWIIDTPDIEYGGMLQCVPHTRWDKSNPQIHRYLCMNQIATYGFIPGDIYLLRTDTTLHRTVPLNREGTRIILNMTWASEQDLRRGLTGADRWWEDSRAEAATRVQTGR
jgi:L-lysine 4-chlorinase